MFCDLFNDNNISPDKGEYILLIKYREKCKDIVKLYLFLYHIFRVHTSRQFQPLVKKTYSKPTSSILLLEASEPIQFQLTPTPGI